MKPAILTVPSASVNLRVVGSAGQLRIPDAIATLRVPSASVNLTVPNAAAILNAGIAAPLENVTLNYCVLETAMGATWVLINTSMWSHLGKIRYRIYDLASGPGKVSPYRPSTDPAKVYNPNISIASCVVEGHSYKLQYWIDCIPDVVGYTEAWYDTTITWTQEPDDGESTPVIIVGQGA